MLTCVCVCLYSSTVKASSVCKMSDTYLRVRINDVDVDYTQCCCQVPSSVSENAIFHLQRRKLQEAASWGENECDINCPLRKDDILI